MQFRFSYDECEEHLEHKSDNQEYINYNKMYIYNKKETIESSVHIM